MRLRAGRAGSAKGAASMLTEGINTATDAGAQAENILVRGDSAYCGGKVVAAVVKTGARFSLAITGNPAVDAAIAAIADEAYTPVHYPGAVLDPDTGQLISHGEVSEVEFTAFAGTRYQTTGRLVVRRVLDANTQDPLFPVWRYHPFFTDNTEPVAQADITHRRHAICETVWSDLIDGPWAHQPSGRFAANAAWTILAAITHNLLRATGTLTGARRYAIARGATLRTHLINIPARLAALSAGPCCTYPRTGPGPRPGSACGEPSSPPNPRPPRHARPTQHHTRERNDNQEPNTLDPGSAEHAHAPPTRSIQPVPKTTPSPVHGSRLRASCSQRSRRPGPPEIRAC